MPLLIDSYQLSGSQGIILTVSTSNHSIIKQSIKLNYMPFSMHKCHPLEAFGVFFLPLPDILQVQLITSKHAYTQ